MDKATYFGYRDLKVYQTSYDLALMIQEITKAFPKEEKFALTDQMRRSSRSGVNPLLWTPEKVNWTRIERGSDTPMSSAFFSDYKTLQCTQTTRPWRLLLF